MYLILEIGYIFSDILYIYISRRCSGPNGKATNPSTVLSVLYAGHRAVLIVEPCRSWTFSEPFNLDFTDFSVCIYVLRGIAENATRAPPKLHKTSPKWNLQPRSNPARLFTQDVLSVTTKAQMTPHISFVHRNKYWNHSFNSISWHCLRKEMKTAL